MLILLPTLLLLLAPALMQGLNLLRRGFALQWLVALLTLLVVMPIFLFLRAGLPLQFNLLTWQPQALFPESPALLLDSVSWPFSMAVVALALAMILTAAARLSAPVEWWPWAGTLALAGLALIAVQAGNALTLLLAWATLDVVDILIVLLQVRQSEGRERGVLALSARLTGSMFLIWASLSVRAQGVALDFQAVPAGAAPFLLLAAGLRLGVIPLQVPLLESVLLRRGLGTSLRLLPVASSLMLLVRAASSEMSGSLASLLIVLTAVAALYSSLSWRLSTSELSGRPFWILTIAAFAVAAAIRGQPLAVLSWGLTLLLAGALLFFYAPRHPRLLPFALIGLFSISALPFSLTWAGLGIYAPQGQGAPGVVSLLGNGIFFISHVLLILGYLKHALTLTEGLNALERWAWLVYPLGLAVLGLALLGFGWVVRLDLEQLSLFDWLLGLVTLAVAVGSWRLFARGARFQSLYQNLLAGSDWSRSFWAALLSLSWFYRLAWVVYRVGGQLLAWLTRVLEGEGGLVWAFVLLALLITLFVG